MTTDVASYQCSICQKARGNCICGGCQTFFCFKHFLEHRQQLSTRFDQDVVSNHDELLAQFHQVQPSNRSFDDLFLQIDQWEKLTIGKTRTTAEKVRHQLNSLITSERETLTRDFENLTKEISRRREEDDFVENDIKLLQQKIDLLQQSCEQFKRPNQKDVMVVESDQIDWNRLLYVEQRSGESINESQKLICYNYERKGENSSKCLLYISVFLLLIGFFLASQLPHLT